MKIINELLKFSKILEKGSAIDDNRIELFEEKYKIRLSCDFKIFMKEMNGFNLMGTEVYCFDVDKTESIENVYYFEHFEVKIPQYSYLVPFSPDGRGNFYCLDTLNVLDNGENPIVFWTSNYLYSENDIPEVTNKNFTDWVQEVVIKWTLEDYNYDGSER